MEDTTAAPRRTLSAVDAVALIIGVVIGTGIFKTPSLVAANTGDNATFFLAWVLGGVISLIGALCYAELATTYPHTGGDYHYLARAFGRKVAFLFGWARMTVIQPGSIAMLAFVFGDYCTQLLPSVYTPSLGAIFAIMSMTTTNLMGTQKGAWMQNILTAVKMFGLISVLIAGAAMAPPLSLSVGRPPNASPSFGLAMVFVLLTYGGWNEAAYISAELREGKSSMVRALLWGLGAITAIYLLAGFSYLKGLGMDDMSRSEVVAADLMRKVLGEGGASFVSLLIAVSALGAINATILTGARSSYAVGRDFFLFNSLGRWRDGANTPVNALLFQAAIASALVLLGTFTRSGFVTMVEFTAPIFWLFFFLTGVSLIILRIRDNKTPRPFKVPLYPLIPVVFCLTCLFMLQASLAYTGIGALVGVGVLLVGAVLAILPRMQLNR